MAVDVRAAIEAIPADKRWGALCFFGEWFGGRPYDGQHELANVERDNEVVVLSFDQGETLTIWNPSGVSLADDGLHVARASSVRWEWFYYACPRTPENRYSIDYHVDSDGVITDADTGDWYEPHHQPDPSADAVAFVRMVLTSG